MRVHSLAEDNALALKSQYGLYKKKAILSDDVRKGKKRNYQKRYCPVVGCSKVVKRIQNHLKQTHKIKGQKIYIKLLNESKKSIIKDMPEEEEEEEETEVSDGGDGEESDYVVFRDLVSRPESQRYLRTIENNEDDISDSEDEDWLVSQTKKWAQQKKVKIRFRDFLTSLTMIPLKIKMH